MKWFFYFLSLILFLGCDSENSLDCFQKSGSLVSKEFSVKEFNRIQVWERVQLIIEQGDTQIVRVETGENLLEEIGVRVRDSVLTVSNRNSCNLVRDYDVTKVYVTSPNIKQIRNSSGLTVESRGVLRYPFLDLVSEDRLSIDEYHIDGDFRLRLDVDWLNINANGISRFYLTGKIWGGFFGVYGGDVRIEAENLEVQRLSFFHRSTNKMIVNPQEVLRGEIRSLGDVISKNRPPIVEVEELFRGRLIFE